MTEILGEKDFTQHKAFLQTCKTGKVPQAVS
jgi:hypothetical protein